MAASPYAADADLVQPDESSVLVQEDKDKSSAWRGGLLEHQLRCIMRVKNDPDHWRIISLNPEIETIKMKAEHDEVMDRLARPNAPFRVASLQKWQQFNLGYMYCNVKSKCFESRELGKLARNQGILACEM